MTNKSGMAHISGSNLLFGHVPIFPKLLRKILNQRSAVRQRHPRVISTQGDVSMLQISRDGFNIYSGHP